MTWPPSFKFRERFRLLPSHTTTIPQHRSLFLDLFLWWVNTMQSLSRWDLQLTFVHIRRTWRVSSDSSDFCNMQYPDSDLHLVLPSCDARVNWRTHFASSPSTSQFSDDFFVSISRRFAALTGHRDTGRFDAPFSYNELVAALSKCHDSASDTDDLSYSIFRVHIPWRRHLLHSFFILILQRVIVPSVWKSSVVVPFFKTDDDPVSHDSYRPISLASRVFKMFEQSVHARIVSHIFPQLDECQGSFRWGVDVMTYSLVDPLRLRRHVHTCATLVDIKKVFHSCWWKSSWSACMTLAFLAFYGPWLRTSFVTSLSQIRVDDSTSQPWVDLGIAEGRVLSSLLFDMLVDSYVIALRSPSSGITSLRSCLPTLRRRFGHSRRSSSSSQCGSRVGHSRTV